MEPYLFTSADELLQRIHACPSIALDQSDPQTQALLRQLIRRRYIQPNDADAYFIDMDKPETWHTHAHNEEPLAYAILPDGYIRLDELRRLAEYDAQQKAKEEEQKTLHKKEADEKTRKDTWHFAINLVVQSLVSIVSVFLAYYLGTL